MTRDIIGVLSTAMRAKIAIMSKRSLKQILNAFWSGHVQWSEKAHSQLLFWRSVQFRKLRASISSDVLGKAVELVFRYPGYLSHHDMSLLYQDASATASGGGLLRRNGNDIRPSRQLYLSRFSRLETKRSSTLREILGILRCLIATEAVSKSRIGFACDNLQSVNAIKFGSRIPEIQRIAEDIFIWCLNNGKVCWPVWLPRTHPVIKEADRRSRMVIPYDDRSPVQVVIEANLMARSLWNLPLSFDQAASHVSAVVVEGKKLPFNAFCWQPHAAGVDMFRSWESWAGNINYVYPPKPMQGRLVTFLPHTKSRAIVAIPLPVPEAWWSFAIQPRAPGVVKQLFSDGFLITAFDFRSCPPVMNGMIIPSHILPSPRFNREQGLTVPTLSLARDGR